MNVRVELAALVVLSALALPCSAEKPEVDFAREVLPILSDKCFICHGPDTGDEDMLRLDSFAAATHDRGGYKAIDPSQPSESVLLERILSEDDPMPPEDAEKQLTDADREVLRRWVNAGGSYAKHWAFVPPKKVPGKGSIDDFISAQLKSAGVDFAPKAENATLKRRVALTLTGLPTWTKELQDPLTKSDSYAEFIEEQFDSPFYGEHQARYWLDAVRYGDTHGLHLDNRRGIYPYRDWVVKAFNDNLPLNDFITWQLAGDLLPNATLEQKVATGFVRMNPTTSEGGAIPAEFQAKNQFDRTESFGTVLLGMSLTCARCHTHKYDPIPQTEYYQLLAFFNSTAESALDGNKYEYGPTAKAPVNQNGWAEWNRLVGERSDLLEGDADLSDAERLKTLAEKGDERAEKLADAFRALEETFTTTLVAKELDEPRETRVLKRGEYDQPLGDALEPGILSVMGAFPEAAPRNRLGLAEWLTDRDHPLVSRVLVNRIWQRVFGYGLVRTPEDFGLQGEHPTHPELLDWLAVELQESGWDLQHMLRLMLTSKTFQQSSAWRSDIDDPENRLFSRGPSYRLDAEVIRDMALATSGLLNADSGGEGFKPYQPDGMWMALAHPASNTKKYERDHGDVLYKRSLYVYWKRTSPHPMMTLFDAPDRESSCVRRSRTNTSLQSLGLLNETQRIEMARSYAERLLRQHETDEQRATSMFASLANRSPTSKEEAAVLGLLTTMRNRYANAIADAKALLELGDVDRDDQLDVAEHAAWTQVAATILASDIALLLY